MLNDLTFVITAFNRPKELRRLLKSINDGYDGVSVNIADDSKKALSDKFFKDYNKIIIHYNYVGFDLGLNYKRNRLLESVKTKYFLLLEEDMIMDTKSNVLEEIIEIIKEIDLALISGIVFNYYTFDLINFLVSIKKIFSCDFSRIINILTKKPELVNFYGIFDNDGHIIFNNINLLGQNLKSFDFYPNFFIGDKGKILSIGGWYPENIKIRGDHIKFFKDFKEAGLKSLLYTQLTVKHLPKKRLLYLIYRMRPY